MAQTKTSPKAKSKARKRSSSKPRGSSNESRASASRKSSSRSKGKGGNSNATSKPQAVLHTVEETAKDAGGKVGRVASKAKVPLMAGGAALAGAAGGIAL